MSSPQPQNPNAVALTRVRQAVAAEEVRYTNALALPAPLVKRFMQLAVTTVANDAKLLAIAARNPQSLVIACANAAECGLNISRTLGEGYLVPFKDTITFIPGYKGLVKLALEGGHVSAIDAEVVFKNEHFSVRYGTRAELEHIPVLGPEEETGEFVCVYAIARMKDGTSKFTVMRLAEVEAVRARSATGSSEKSPWSTDWLEMAKKTAVRRLCKMLPLSPRAERALLLEEERDAEREVTMTVEREVSPSLGDAGAPSAQAEDLPRAAEPPAAAPPDPIQAAAADLGPPPSDDDAPPWPGDEEAPQPAGKRRPGAPPRQPAPRAPAPAPAAKPAQPAQPAQAVTGTPMPSDVQRQTLADAIKLTKRNPLSLINEILGTNYAPKEFRLTQVTLEQFHTIMQRLNSPAAKPAPKAEEEDFFE